MQPPASESNGKPAPKFDVFISYSHDDEGIAERLSKRIRRYKTPRTLSKRQGGLSATSSRIEAPRISLSLFTPLSLACLVRLIFFVQRCKQEWEDNHHNQPPERG